MNGATANNHSHVFLGAEHHANERRAWAVIWLCAAMMAAEIVGGLWFGSIALVADGIHMSTHAGALLLAAMAYGYARRHADDPRFTLGTGKLGDLAGFGSAIILTMIAILVGYEAIGRLFAPVPIRFGEAIPIAAVGLAVNVASAWLLSGGGRDGGHAHSHDRGAAVADHEHDHAHGFAARDNNMRAAIVHVAADALVSVLVIAGLVVARVVGGLWIDPAVAIVGACVILGWSYGLIRDTGSVLLDMVPDRRLADELRAAIETDGDTLADLHLWRLGPGHLGAILSIRTAKDRGPEYYRERLGDFPSLSHLTIEVQRQ